LRLSALRGRFGALRFLLALPLLFAAAAWAHEFTLEALVSAFLKVEGREAHLVVRAPLYLFKAVRFPVRGVEVDVEHSGDAMHRALAALQAAVVVTENGRRLQASTASGRLALPSDRSFDVYERAAAHVAAPVEPDTRIVVFTAAALDTSKCRADVEVVELDRGEFTLTTALRHLREHHQVRTLLCEGGPTLLGALLQESLVHELFLTLAPKLTGGGTGPPLSSGPELAELQQLQLQWLLERAGSLYLRYALAG